MTETRPRPAADREWPRRRSRDRRGIVALHTLAVAFALATLVVATYFISTTTHSRLLLAYWCVIACAQGGSLVTYLIGHRVTHQVPAAGRVLCLVPVFNEPRQVLRETVDSLLAQTVPVDIIVIDDGSTTPVEPCVDHPRVRWMWQANAGKRAAQTAALRSVDPQDYAFILTVDSDSQPFPDACEQMLRAFQDPEVWAVTGIIYVRNHRESFLSMAADMDIGMSCTMMRASRTFLGALETTSGALAMYRSQLLFDHLETYRVVRTTGDDRWLATRALRRGKVICLEEARVATDMPTTLRATWRQRLRWGRSWWGMLPYVFRHLRFAQVVSPLIGLMESLMMPFILVSMLPMLLGGMGHARGDTSTFAVYYVGTFFALRYATAFIYLTGRPNVSLRDKVVLFFVGTPAALLMSIFILMPSRTCAILRPSDTRWLSRQIDPNAEMATS